MLTLFTSPGACSRASHIALEESGLAFEVRLIDFGKAEQRTPEFLAVNPKGRVPALAVDEGVLTETPAILAYVASLSAPGALAPTEPFAFASMQAFNAYLASTVHVAHAHRRRASRWADDEAAQAAMSAKVPANMRDGFARIESGLEGPWVMGDAYSVADPYLFTIAGWLGHDDVDLAEFPRVADHFARMSARPAVQRALEAEQTS